MMRERPPLLAALVAYLVWGAITVFGPLALPAPGAAAAGEGVYGALALRPGWHFLAAALFALLAAWLLTGGSGLSPPHPPARWAVLGWPLTLIPVLVAAALLIAPGVPRAFGVLALNTAFIALSEELMFRRVLFETFRRAGGDRGAILRSSLLFGAVHLANLPLTGSLGVTLMQAVAAAMSGVFFAVIVLRTGSLLPAVLYHFLWNLATLMLSGAIAGAAAGPKSADFPGLLVPLLLVLPNFLQALSSLRALPGKRG